MILNLHLPEKHIEYQETLPLLKAQRFPHMALQESKRTVYSREH